MTKRIDTKERNKQIAARYAELVSADVSPDDAIQKISDEQEIGKFYVRSILRAIGVRIDRKGQYDRKGNLSDRDRQIIELAEKGETPEDIGSRFEITPTRVRQVVRDNVTDLKHVRIERTLSEIKNEVANYQEMIKSNENMKSEENPDGIDRTWKTWYRGITSKYGEKTMREIKSNLGYNLFKESQRYRDENIVQMGKIGGFSAQYTADKHGLCKDYVYSIWHNNGVHKDKKKKLTPKERQQRDAKIREACKTKKVGEVAKDFGLSYTMVKLINSDNAQ